jgi:hypothetical protein
MAPHPYYCQNLPIQALSLGWCLRWWRELVWQLLSFFLFFFNEHQLSMNKEKRDGGEESEINERRKEKIK